MLEREALELIDAHLDDDLLTDQQVEQLTAWLNEHPQHAKQVFHRLHLHAFLRRRLHAQRLLVTSDRTDLSTVPSNDVVRPTDLFLQPPGNAVVHTGKSWSRKVLLACGILLACVMFMVIAAGLWLSNNQSPAIPFEAPYAYEGFDYPATSIPAPAIDAATWPTTGGMQGLSGGDGWAEPWQEDGSKVSVIVDHARELNWDPKDMRKFKPLEHVDVQGNVLQTSGLQMRTAMGVRSLTTRGLDLAAFPPSMIDESGLGSDGTILWLSFLAQSFNSTAENNRYTYFQVGTRDVSGFRLGKIGAAPSGNWTAAGLLTGAQVNVRSSAVPSGEMSFLVARLEFRPGPEEATVWINPGLSSEPKLADATLRLSVPDFRFDAVRINANFSTDIDEIRIGPSFRAVAPIGK
ncbi:MAG: hypothetical protein C0478_15615 [Planctomyces sp.]|nr:hypothetical protein [Planctomyces sp.]